MIQVKFNLLSKKTIVGECLIQAENATSAFESYRQALSEFEKFLGEQPVAASVPTKKSAEPASESTTQLSGKRAEKAKLLEVNQDALKWAAHAIAAIEELNGKTVPEVMENFSPDKDTPPAAMNLAQITSLKNNIASAIRAYAAAKPAAEAYLEIVELIDAATSMEDLKARKESFRKWKVLGTNSVAFQAAKAFHDQKEAILSTVEGNDTEGLQGYLAG